MRHRRFALGAVVLGLASLSPLATGQSIVFAENFESGSAYTETTLGGVPAATLWHGEGSCTLSTGYFGPFVGAAGFTSIVGSPGEVVLFDSAIGTYDDSLSAVTPLPSPVPYFGAAQTTFRVDTNGNFRFGAGGFSDFTNDPIPAAAAPNNAIYPFWDDCYLLVGSGASLSFLVTGAGDLIVEWNDVEQFPAGGAENATFQVVVHPDGAIDFNYDFATFAGVWSASIGLEDAAGAVGIDATGGGAANAGFPATNLVFVPDVSGGAVAPIAPSMGTTAAAYNQGDIAIYTFDTGAANEGALESPVHPAGDPTDEFEITFDYIRDAEGGATFDTSFVEAGPAGGPFASLAQITSLVQCVTPATVSVAVGPVSAAPWQHRFVFDTVDGIANAFLGWYVDNVVVSRNCTLFVETFEGGGLGSYTETDLAGAPAATLWHGEGLCAAATPIPASMGTNAAAYNQGDLAVPVYTFATGVANEGAIESPVLPSSPIAAIELTFDFIRETETGATFDQCFVESRTVPGAYASVAQITTQAACASKVTTTVAVSNVPGGPWQHRFVFDTVDSVGNAYLGWYLDNVIAHQVTSSGSHTSLPTGCGAPAPVMSVTGPPTIGSVLTYTMTGFTGIPLVWVGFPSAAVLCPAGCTLGATLFLVFPTPSISGLVPCDPALVGGSFRVQGADILAPAGCAVPVPFELTNTIETIIG